MGAAARRQRTRQVDGDHAGAGHIVGAAQQLLCQLTAALTDGHSAQRTIAGVGVRTQDHLAAAREPLAHVLVDDRQMGRHEDAAVFFGCGQAEPVVVLVDGAAYGAQAVVAVGEHVRDGELFQARCAGRLDDAHKGDVMAGHGVELDLQVLVIAAGVVCRQDAVGHGALGGIRHSGGIKALRGQCRRGVCICVDPCAAHIVRAARAAFDGFQHFPSPLSIRPGLFPPFPADALEPEPLHRSPALPVLLSRTAYRGWR